jgi:hypothetical protein
MWAQQEQRSPSRIVSGAGSLKSPGKRGGTNFSPRPRQRACQDPLTLQGGDALSLFPHIGKGKPINYKPTRLMLLQDPYSLGHRGRGQLKETGVGVASACPSLS